MIGSLPDGSQGRGSATERKTSDERKAMLAAQVTKLVAQGRRVESRSEYDAVLLRGRVVELREVVAVDEWGNVSVTRLPIDRARIFLLVGFALLVLTVIALILVGGD